MSRLRIGDLALYHERHGSGRPLIAAPGGFGTTEMFAGLAPALAAGNTVVPVDLQGHGRTADIDRPLRYELLGDDLAALARELDAGPVDLLGYSLGGGAALRTAIQHPRLVRRLVLVSTPYARDGWWPEIRAQMDTIG